MSNEKPAKTGSKALSLNDRASDGGLVRFVTGVEASRTIFTRDINDDGVITVTTDTDDPALWKLARKGDTDYWTHQYWNDDEGRRMWTADIVARMLEEGLIAVDEYGPGIGMDAAITAMPSHEEDSAKYGSHAVTATIARIRGLRLIQELVPNTFDDAAMYGLFNRNNPDTDAARGELLVKTRGHVYSQFDRPPWRNGPPWTETDEHGYATGDTGNKVFVGEKGDLLWRALTEQDRHGGHRSKRSGRTKHWTLKKCSPLRRCTTPRHADSSQPDCSTV